MRRWLAETVYAIMARQEEGWVPYLTKAGWRMLGYDAAGSESPEESAADMATLNGGGGRAGALWHGALASILVLYELLYRNRTFTRAAFELDRAERRQRVGAQTDTEHGDDQAADHGAAEADDAEAATQRCALQMLSPSARTTLVSGLLHPAPHCGGHSRRAVRPGACHTSQTALACSGR